MLFLNMFDISDNAMIYRASNEYFIFERGDYFELVVSVLNAKLEEIDEWRFDFDALSEAIAAIEKIEDGREDELFE